jgi:hypothetical protein
MIEGGATDSCEGGWGVSLLSVFWGKEVIFKELSLGVDSFENESDIFANETRYLDKNIYIL